MLNRKNAIQWIESLLNPQDRGKAWKSIQPEIQNWAMKSFSPGDPMGREVLEGLLDENRRASTVQFLIPVVSARLGKTVDRAIEGATREVRATGAKNLKNLIQHGPSGDLSGFLAGSAQEIGAAALRGVLYGVLQDLVGVEDDP